MDLKKKLKELRRQRVMPSTLKVYAILVYSMNKLNQTTISNMEIAKKLDLTKRSIQLSIAELIKAGAITRKVVPDFDQIYGVKRTLTIL